MDNVLLVDDEQIIRKGIKKLLEEVITGYKVLWEASNGAEALNISNIVIPDLVITDIRMPVMNGLDFIFSFTKKYPQVPVIVISGYEDYSFLREALKLGVKDYLLKPISRDELTSTLQSISKKREKELTIGESINISNIKSVINDNLEKGLTLNFISSILNLHPNYISQLFKQETGINISEYITKIRIEKAKELLTQTNLKVCDISNLVGFVNSKHFIVVFKKYESCTPFQYKNSKKTEKS